MADENNADPETDDLVPDVPPDPPDGLGLDGTGTPLIARDEDDPYGLDIRTGTDVVQSDEVGAALLSAEYLDRNAADDTNSSVAEVDDAWADAASNATEKDFE